MALSSDRVMPGNREVELLRLARDGNAAASEELFVKYLKESKSVQGLLRRSLPVDDREEMLHEIFLQLVSGKNIFRGDAHLSTYVYQVARVTIFQKFRRENTLKRGRVYRAISTPVDIADGIGSNPEYTYSLKEVKTIIAGLIE